MHTVLGIVADTRFTNGNFHKKHQLLTNLLASLFQALQDEGPLLGHDTLHVQIVHVGVHVALHQRATVVIFDVPHPPRVQEIKS